MNYSIRKKLKDARYPCKFTHDCDCFPSPSLSELVEACGSEFLKLEKGETSWIAYSTGVENKRMFVSEVGDTAEEAVANLWLLINSEDVMIPIDKEEVLLRDEDGEIINGEGY